MKRPSVRPSTNGVPVAIRAADPACAINGGRPATV